MRSKNPQWRLVQWNDGTVLMKIRWRRLGKHLAISKELIVGQALSLAAGLVGVLVGAYLFWTSTRRHRRIEMIFALHKEYNSIDMVQARYRASALLGENPKVSYNELRVTLGGVQMQDVWTVVSFYRRLWLMIKHGGVYQKPIPELFGDYFT